MQNEELENQIDFLFSAALKKCGNLHDAEDLTQETLLCALSYTAKGKHIEDMRAWLLTVLNHKWNDQLRRKYRQPVIGIGDGFDIMDDGEEILNVELAEEAEQVRKAVAYLEKTYREVIVRHYMNGEKIEKISEELGIPEGTVKSRLFDGREKVKKGMETMESYTKQSYSPVTLKVYNSGKQGRNGEPGSLVNRDLLAQNILWAAYEKPISAEEIAKAIGVATAYAEPVIQKLVDGELMKQVGNKYYTDFIIYTVEDREKHIPAQKEFVKNYFDLFWNGIDEGLRELRKENFYQQFNLDERNSLEMYFAFHCLDSGLAGILNHVLGKQEIPYRKDGGRWIAFGRVYFKKFDLMEHPDIKKHSYTGERFTFFKKLTDKKVLLRVFSANGFPNYSYYASPDYGFLRENDDMDEILTKLLFLLHTGIPFEYLGFSESYLKSVPWLTKCKILREEKGRPEVNIPILGGTEYERLLKLLDTSTKKIYSDELLKMRMGEFLKNKKKEYPSHIQSVFPFKQYMHAYTAIVFSCVREAIKRGKLYDGNYDDDSEGVNQHPCPMILVIDESGKEM